MLFYHDTSCPAFSDNHRPCDCGYRQPKDAIENLKEAIKSLTPVIVDLSRKYYELLEAAKKWASENPAQDDECGNSTANELRAAIARAEGKED